MRSVGDTAFLTSPRRPLLAGIFIEHRKASQIMLATNIVVHMELTLANHAEFLSVLTRRAEEVGSGEKLPILRE